MKDVKMKYAIMQDVKLKGEITRDAKCNYCERC